LLVYPFVGRPVPGVIKYDFDVLVFIESVHNYGGIGVLYPCFELDEYAFYGPIAFVGVLCDFVYETDSQTGKYFEYFLTGDEYGYSGYING
jgi:hypothetical protein